MAVLGCFGGCFRGCFGLLWAVLVAVLEFVCMCVCELRVLSSLANRLDQSAVFCCNPLIRGTAPEQRSKMVFFHFPQATSPKA